MECAGRATSDDGAFRPRSNSRTRERPLNAISRLVNRTQRLGQDEQDLQDRAREKVPGWVFLYLFRSCAPPLTGILPDSAGCRLDFVGLRQASVSFRFCRILPDVAGKSAASIMPQSHVFKLSCRILPDPAGKSATLDHVKSVGVYDTPSLRHSTPPCSHSLHFY